jgi:hypothetical protein
MFLSTYTKLVTWHLCLPNSFVLFVSAGKSKVAARGGSQVDRHRWWFFACTAHSNFNTFTTKGKRKAVPATGCEGP